MVYLDQDGPRRQIIFFVNGKKVVEESADPKQSLADYLRLRLTGTKIGCNEGGCGACTVMLSHHDSAADKIIHRSVNACLTPMCLVDGMAVTTVEGITGGSSGELHPVQERLYKAHGSQCGFCTPGFVMAMYALLRSKTDERPSIEDIDESLQGNLCRCTGYRPILEAFQSFAKQEDITQNGGFSKPMNGDCCRQNGKGGKTGGCCREQGEPDTTTLEIDYAAMKPYDPTQEPIFPPELQLQKYTTDELRIEKNGVRWYRPNSLAQLLKLRAEHSQAKIIGGNSEIGIEMKLLLRDYPVLIDAHSVHQLYDVQLTEDGLFIGASNHLNAVQDLLKVYVAKLKESQTGIFRGVLKTLHWFAGKHIRNVATIAGNIITASPISDLNPIWLASGAKISVQSAKGGQRDISINDKFFTGYRKTVVKPEEIVLGITIPFSEEGQFFQVYKQAQRREDDIAIVNGAFSVQMGQNTSISKCQLAFGGMAITTISAKETQKFLTGKRFSMELFEGSIPCLLKDLPMPGGTPGGMERYRQSLALSFLFRYFTQLNENIQSDGNFDGNQHQFDDHPKHARMQATKIYPPAPDSQSPSDPVGRPLAHASGWKHTIGAHYTYDLEPSNCVHLYPVISKKARAKLVSVDPSPALKMDGVIDYVDWKDIPNEGTNIMGLFGDQTLFAKDEVQCCGQVIGAILAEDPNVARRAAAKVMVEYRVTEKPILTCKDAIDAGWRFDNQETYGNVRGENDEILEPDWSQCELIEEGEVHIGGQDHFYLETHASVAIPQDYDEMTLFAGTQNASAVQAAVAQLLGWQMHQIVVRIKRLGGGFGAKEAVHIIPMLTAIGAYKCKRPVKCALERFEDMAMTGQRAPFLARYKIGHNATGKIQGYDVEFYGNSGWTRDLTPPVVLNSLTNADQGYNLPNMRARGNVMKTNTQTNTAFRAFGRPQALIALECAMDAVAARLDKPGDDIRQLNLYENGDSTHYFQRIEHSQIRRMWNECRKLANFDDRRKAVDAFNKTNRYKKRGIAMVPLKYGSSYPAKIWFLSQAGALVHIYPDGSVMLAQGGMEMGQGVLTKLTQIAARVLQCPYEKVRILETSTDKTPNQSPTAASLTMDLNGPAVEEACRKLFDRMAPVRKAYPDKTWTEWCSLSYHEFMISLSATGFYKIPHPQSWNDEKKRGQLYRYFTAGVGCSEVEIDCLTGDHRLIGVDIVMDVGNSINPAIDLGQIEGAFVQGYGLVTMENMKVSASGEWRTRGPGTYKIPSADDIPRHFNVQILPNQTCPDSSIYSSKLLGEPPLLSAVSVLMALKDAIRAYRRQNNRSIQFTLHSPATAERIRMACEDEIVDHVPELADPSTFTPWTVTL